MDKSFKIVILLNVLVVLMIVRTIILSPDFDQYCIEKYGSGYKFGYVSIYTESGCELREGNKLIDRNIDELDDIMVFCNIPNLFDLTKWRNDCR